MKVTHEIVVSARCPHGGADIYAVTIETDRLIRVEQIIDALDEFTAEPIYQENLTEALAGRLGARVTTVGTHLGVDTTVVSEARA